MAHGLQQQATTAMPAPWRPRSAGTTRTAPPPSDPEALDGEGRGEVVGGTLDLGRASLSAGMELLPAARHAAAGPSHVPRLYPTSYPNLVGPSEPGRRRGQRRRPASASGSFSRATMGGGSQTLPLRTLRQAEPDRSSARLSRGRSSTLAAAAADGSRASAGTERRGVGSARPRSAGTERRPRTRALGSHFQSNHRGQSLLLEAMSRRTLHEAEALVT